MGRLVVVVALMLCAAGCAARGVPSAGASPPVAPVASIPAAPTAGPTPSPVPLQASLPVRIGTTVLHSFPVGQDWLTRLASRLGVSRSSLDVAYASDHGAAFVQMYAIRALGFDTSELLATLAAVAYPTGKADVSSKTIAGREVTVINQAETANRLGTFYAFGIGDALIVAEAFAEPVVERAFQALPGS